jgi:hypothetical protein
MWRALREKLWALTWDDTLAEHVPTDLDAGGVMRVRQCEGLYRVEARVGTTGDWRVVTQTSNRAKVQAIAQEYVG